MIRPIGGKLLSDTPETMKDLDLPDDLAQTILEWFDEMHVEAQIASGGIRCLDKLLNETPKLPSTCCESVPERLIPKPLFP